MRSPAPENRSGAFCPRRQWITTTMVPFPAKEVFLAGAPFGLISGFQRTKSFGGCGRRPRPFRLAATRGHKSPLRSGRGAKTFQWKVFAWGNPIKGFPHGSRAALSALPFLNSPFFLLFPACRATMFLQGFPLKKNSHGRHNVLRAHYALHEVRHHPIQPVSRHHD